MGQKAKRGRGKSVTRGGAEDGKREGHRTEGEEEDGVRRKAAYANMQLGVIQAYIKDFMWIVDEVKKEKKKIDGQAKKPQVVDNVEQPVPRFVDTSAC